MAKKKNVEYVTKNCTIFKFREDPGKKKFKEENDKQNMSFLLCEGFLNKMLEYARRMRTKDNLKFFEKTNDFWEGFLLACRMWFDYCKAYCEDFPPKMREPKASEKKKFKYIETLENGEKFEWPLVGIIDYRGDTIPVYDDDAGQCFFCRLPDGTTVGGGGWNPDPEEEFCWAYDDSEIK